MLANKYLTLRDSKVAMENGNFIDDVQMNLFHRCFLGCPTAMFDDRRVTIWTRILKNPKTKQEWSLRASASSQLTAGVPGKGWTGNLVQQWTRARSASSVVVDHVEQVNNFEVILWIFYDLLLLGSCGSLAADQFLPHSGQFVLELVWKQGHEIRNKAKNGVIKTATSGSRGFQGLIPTEGSC